MKKRKKIKLGVVIGVSAILIYSISPLIPNMFVKKGIDKTKLQVIAHRGGAGIGIENTLSCIEKGISYNVDMVEVDIHLTKDNHIVVMHDQTIDRMTNGSGSIADITLEEIKEFRIIDKDGNLTNEQIPTLEEVFSLVSGRTKLLIEIKKADNIYQGIEDKLLEVIRIHNAFSWVAVQSFDDSVLEGMHRIAPELRLEKLFIYKLPWLPYIFDGKITQFNVKKYAHISSFNVFHQAASKSLINDIKKEGKEVKIWTVDGPENTPDLPVDGIITDYPDLWH